MKRFLLTVIVLLSYYFAFSQAPHTVRYDLYVSDSMMHNHGKMIHAMVINGGIPAPVLTFTEGDTAEIYVHNKMDMETSVHWHGLILPNRYDGVSYLTTADRKSVV